MPRARRPLHAHVPSAPSSEESTATREAVAGELTQLTQICTEVAGERYAELVAAGDSESARAASEMAHELAEILRNRAQQWQPERE